MSADNDNGSSNGHVWATATELAELERRQDDKLEAVEFEVRGVRADLVSTRARVATEHLDVHALTGAVRELRLYVELCFDLANESREKEAVRLEVVQSRTDRMLMLVCAKLGIEVPV